MERSLPTFADIAPRIISRPADPFSTSPKTRISRCVHSPKMGIKMHRSSSGTPKNEFNRYIFIPIFGEQPHFPENPNNCHFCFTYRSIKVSTCCQKPASLSSCRGPCAQHGKEQQVVSCPPRRRRPGRLSLRSVRPSVERQDLAGAGIAPPTPSPSETPGSRQSTVAGHAQPYVPEHAR